MFERPWLPRRDEGIRGSSSPEVAPPEPKTSLPQQYQWKPSLFGDGLPQHWCERAPLPPVAYRPLAVLGSRRDGITYKDRTIYWDDTSTLGKYASARTRLKAMRQHAQSQSQWPQSKKKGISFYFGIGFFLLLFIVYIILFVL